MDTTFTVSGYYLEICEMHGTAWYIILLLVSHPLLTIGIPPCTNPVIQGEGEEEPITHSTGSSYVFEVLYLISSLGINDSSGSAPWWRVAVL